MSTIPKIFAQISRAQAHEKDRICISFVSSDPKQLFNIRAEMKLSDFAETLTSGAKVECDLTRLRWFNWPEK